MQQLKTGIIGGSFNPPTIGHALMAAELLNLKIVDKVVFVPCGDRSDKELTSCHHRLNMLKLMIQSQFQGDYVEVNEIEIQNRTMIPTYHMLKQIESQYSNIHFVIGSDLIESLPSWHEGHKLIKDTKFIILNRPSAPLESIAKELLPQLYQTVPNFEFGISSTEIRKRVQQSNSKHLNCLGMLSFNVIQYIKDNNLYK